MKHILFVLGLIPGSGAYYSITMLEQHRAWTAFLVVCLLLTICVYALGVIVHFSEMSHFANEVDQQTDALNPRPPPQAD